MKLKYMRPMLAALPFTAVLAGIIIAQVFANTPEWVKELLLATLAAVTVHLVDHVWLQQTTEGLLTQQKAEFQSAIVTSSASLTSTIKADTELLKRHLTASLDQIKRQISLLISLSAMNKSHIGRIYSSRHEAADDIASSMIDPENKTLKVIGISLNDFVLGGDAQLRRVWEQIQSWVRNGRGGRPLDIKLLLIDPSSWGAALRGMGEERRDQGQPTRLAEDVKSITDSLKPSFLSSNSAKP